MTWKAEVSDSAVQSTTVLREPIQTTEKWKWNKFSVLRAERPSLRASIHCLWQWPYHSKIPHAGAALGYFDCILQDEFASVNNFFCVASILSPHTNQSLRALFKWGPNLQWRMSFRSSEMYSATLSPLACWRLWKLNRSVVMNSLGLKCPFSMETNSSKSLSFGSIGANRLWRSE